ncbi:MAG: endonuclease III [Firmicutes bacterium]|nr:endonuclease III [Bacillota bacterium]
MTEKRIKDADVYVIIEELEKLYPGAKAELNYTTPFELLIATILSAQCTDIRVNLVTAELYKEHNTPDKIVELGNQGLINYIRSCGLYKSKAKNIIETSKIIMRDFEGEVPEKLDELVSLPGVGRKTANVVMSNAFGTPAIAVDTHVQRVSNRIGLANSKDVLKTEKQLMDILPREKWTLTHHMLIHHGRRVCKARKPECDICTIAKLCSFFNTKE